MPEPTNAQVLAVACPRCASKPGQHCGTTGPRIETPPCTDRITAAQQTFAGWRCWFGDWECPECHAEHGDVRCDFEPDPFHIPLLCYICQRLPGQPRPTESP